MAWSSNRFHELTIVNRTDNRPSGIQAKNRTALALSNKGSGPAGFANIQTGHATGNSGSNVQKLEGLVPGLTANIIGIVISKESPRSVFSKKNGGTERFLLGFVIRDSSECFVNCTYWGKEHFIADLAKSFTIGDVVDSI